MNEYKHAAVNVILNDIKRQAPPPARILFATDTANNQQHNNSDNRQYQKKIKCDRNT